MLQEVTELNDIQVEARAGREPLPPLLVHIVRPLLPPLPVLPARQQAEVERAAVSFVAAQIAAMPLFLQLPYRLALQLFNWLALLRYARPYSRLDAERQQAYMLFWSRSRLPVMRDFVKLIRSCALLQYLDHPLVLAHLEAMEEEESCAV